MTRILLLACVLGVFHAGEMQTERDQAVRMATNALASVLKIAPEKIHLVSAEPVDWPNSSLGCPKPDMAYLPVIIPGFRVRLAFGDRQYELHTGSGRAILCDDAAGPAAPSRSRTITPALAAADRAKQHLASALKVKPDEVSVGRVRAWLSTEAPCNPPGGTTVDGETFSVELKSGTTTYRYRATPDVAWACK